MTKEQLRKLKIGSVISCEEGNDTDIAIILRIQPGGIWEDDMYYFMWSCEDYPFVDYEPEWILRQEKWDVVEL